MFGHPIQLNVRFLGKFREIVRLKPLRECLVAACLLKGTPNGLTRRWPSGRDEGSNFWGFLSKKGGAAVRGPGFHSVVSLSEVVNEDS
jgi:hypothetical protein